MSELTNLFQRGSANDISETTHKTLLQLAQASGDDFATIMDLAVENYHYADRSTRQNVTVVSFLSYKYRKCANF
jgi:hypothetical protein